MKLLRSKTFWAYGLFWSWNAIFLAFMILGFAPLILPDITTAVRGGDIPSSYLVYGSILTAIPVIAVILGLTVLREYPERVFAFGYGVEGPLMLVLALRFFLIRQLMPQLAVLLIVAALGVLTYSWHLLDRKLDQRGAFWQHLRLIGTTLLLLVGLYASVWIAFYALPFGIEGLKNVDDFLRGLWVALTDFNWSDIDWTFMPLTLLGVPLFIYTATLFIIMPIAVPILYIRAWWHSVRAVAQISPRRRAAVVTTAVLTLVAILLIATDPQPQATAFALLESPPETAVAAAELMAQDNQIREGLLNAYLAPQRYISAQGEMDHIRIIYRDVLGLSLQDATRIQRLYETVARPILYRPSEPTPNSSQNFRTFENRVFQKEPEKAAELYQSYFDEPITEGEKETVVDAVRATWLVEQARAGWQMVDDREILMTHQEVTIAEHDGWADVELYEVYQNQTFQRQEVVYYFSLPETAVVTGIWLGNSHSRDQRFVYQVAPRGAAQATYQAQVQRRIDPALVEQIGPSQYRLRIFPIEPMSRNWQSDGRNPELIDGTPMHMWLTYRVMAQPDGWALPHLAKKLNVYWDDTTTRLLNGAPLDLEATSWLPATAAAETAVSPTIQRFDFANGRTVLLRPASDADQPAVPTDLRLAVVLDRSRSMTKLSDTVQDALAEIGTWDTAVDLYLTSTAMHGTPGQQIALDAVDDTALTYAGGQNPGELLAQFAAMQGNARYDAVLVLTDGTGYETGEPTTAVPPIDVPLWMVHLDGRFPLGYDDDTLAVIQASGGGTVASVSDALTRLLISQPAVEGVTTDWVDGYLWTTMPTETANAMSIAMTPHAADDPLTAVAARSLILAEQAAQRGQLDDLAVLDSLHTIAVAQSIVTPYSSMIVLVNEQQQQMLERLSNEDDRFEREFEGVGETDQAQLAVTGVPEPEEWLLIGIVLLMLGWYAKKNGRLPVKRWA